MSRIPRMTGVAVSLAAIAVVWALASLFTPPPPPVSGSAVVVDGDTLRIGSGRIRLTGLDAPELDQDCTAVDGSAWPCGQRARAFLIGAVDGATVTCTPSGRDRYRRLLARCTTAAGDLAAAIVGAGWAVPELDYAAQGLTARTAGLGIWSGTFEAPADWRRDHGEPGISLWDWLKGWFDNG